MQPNTKTILVTGATGYVGGRLIPRLLGAGHTVHALVRGGTERLAGRPWQPEIKVVDGDVLQPQTLTRAMQGVDVAYYLIHSMGGDGQFRERDQEAARNFAHAAKKAGVQQIIYLGGLGATEQELSEHLQSRQESGDALREAGVPVTEFRAGMIIGSGSLSFEMVRHLTERLPVMICPKWTFNRTQPIAIRDVLGYLIAALERSEIIGQIIEIGGSSTLPYIDILKAYAHQRGLRRIFIPIPVLSPTLSSHWVHWMTPVPGSIARPLIEGLRNDLIVHDQSAHEFFPSIQPMDHMRAIKLALARIQEGNVETLWSDALVSSQGNLPPVYLTQEQGMLIERRETLVMAPPDVVFQVVAGIGGKRGWPSYNWLWEARGLLDRFFGGVGMRRGRRHPDELRVGDALDFWRVEAIVPNELLLLHAEMKLPGEGWLRFRVRPCSDPNQTRLVQAALFAPKGLLGLLYWYSIYPLHGFIFSSMIDRLAAKAETTLST